VTKPVRPIQETGQAGFAWAVGKNSTCGKNSNFTSNDIPIRFRDSNETLGIAGVPHGLPLAKSSSPKTHQIKRNRKPTSETTSPRTPSKTTKSKAFHEFGGARSLRKEDHVVMCDAHTKIRKETPPETFPRKSQEKTPKIAKKEKGRGIKNTWGITSNLLYIP
jgi:hypothetical protein